MAGPVGEHETAAWFAVLVLALYGLGLPLFLLVQVRDASRVRDASQAVPTCWDILFKTGDQHIPPPAAPDRRVQFLIRVCSATGALLVVCLQHGEPVLSVCNIINVHKADRARQLIAAIKTTYQRDLSSRKDERLQVGDVDADYIGSLSVALPLVPAVCFGKRQSL